MDPFAAISLAGNVLGFIDFASRFLATAKEIHSSSLGSTERDQTVKQVTRDLQRFASSLKACQSPAAKPDPASAALIDLCSDCEDVAEDLLHLLTDVQAQDPTSKRQSIKTAIKRFWKSKDIDDFQQRLVMVSQGLDRRVEDIFRNETRQSLCQIIKSGNAQQVDISMLQKHVENIRDGVSVASFDSGALKQLREVVTLSDEAVLKARQTLILEELRFDEMTERFDQVETAHSGTFEWILGDTPSGGQPKARKMSMVKASRCFNQWLRDDSTIFHVLGKPGSGKSTLMKFLCEHPKVRQQLELWASDKGLLLSNFFFWRAGSRMQRSIHGLIQGLIHAVLQAAPHFIPLIFPDHWPSTDFATSGTPGVRFERKDVMNAFQRLISSPEVFDAHRFVFFIDGLDEYEPEGHKASYIDLACLLKEWCSNNQPSIKICISSREYPVFEIEFLKYPRLRIQYLTVDDMHQVANNYLGGSNHVSRLKLDQQQLQKLEYQLVKSSDGVFLWLTLIIRNLEVGIINGDDFNDVWTRILSLPTELSDLFTHILKSIPSDDKAYCFPILRLMKEAHSYSISLLDFWCIDMALRNDGLGHVVERISPPNSKPSHKESQLREECVNLSRRIQGRFRGLLDSPKDSRKKNLAKVVTFSHRSIYDFLDSEGGTCSLGVHYTGYDWYQGLVNGFEAVSALMMHPQMEFLTAYLTKSTSVSHKDFGRHASEFWGNRLVRLARFTRIRLGTLPQCFYRGFQSCVQILSGNPKLSTYWDAKVCPQARYCLLSTESRWFSTIKCTCQQSFHISEYQPLVWALAFEHLETKGLLGGGHVAPEFWMMAILGSSWLTGWTDQDSAFTSPFTETCRLLLESGLDPNSFIAVSKFQPGADLGESPTYQIPLLFFFTRQILSELEKGIDPWRAMQLSTCLEKLVEHGLDTRLWFVVANAGESKISNSLSYDVFNFVYGSSSGYDTDYNWRVTQEYWAIDLELIKTVPCTTIGYLGFVTLLDVLDHYQFKLLPLAEESLRASKESIHRFAAASVCTNPTAIVEADNPLFGRLKTGLELRNGAWIIGNFSYIVYPEWNFLDQ